MYWKRGKLIPKREIVDLWIRQGKTKKEIMKRYGCNLSIVNKTLKHYNVDILRERYIRFLFNTGSRQYEIANKINKDQAVVSRKLNAMGIDGRPTRAKRIKQTVKEKYGVDNIQQLDSVRRKTSRTNLKRYGYDTPLRIFNCHLTDDWKQNGEKYTRRSQKSARSTKTYIWPSGKRSLQQGYENLCLDFLLESYDESDIVTGKNVPIIRYFCDGKNRRHYPDIFIPKENKIIEVKSTYTKQITKYLFEKMKAAQKQGYKYEIWVFDKTQSTPLERIRR